MQLKHLRESIEKAELTELVVWRYKGGWSLLAFEDVNQTYRSINEHALHRARGGVRTFKTLDAVKKLVEAELDDISFTVS